MKDIPRDMPLSASEGPSPCHLCQKAPAPVRIPFAVGRPDSPPLPREYRVLGLGPRRKRFVQRYQWVWHILWLCRGCHREDKMDPLWSAIQNHPETRKLVDLGYTETRLDPGFQGRDGDVTQSEEPV